MRWYVRGIGGQAEGPFEEEEVLVSLRAGNYQGGEVFREGEDDWRAVTSHQPFAAAIANSELALSEPKKELEFGLKLMILIAPLIFCWFSLRKGYSTRARVFAFALPTIYLLVIIVGVSVGLYRRHHRVAQEQELMLQPRLDRIEISSIQLAEDYNASVEKSDDMYQGELLRVIGNVEELSSDPDTNPVLILVGSEKHNVLAYNLPPASVANYSKGQRVVMNCTGGGMSSGSVILFNCKLEKPSVKRDTNNQGSIGVMGTGSADYKRIFPDAG